MHPPPQINALDLPLTCTNFGLAQLVNKQVSFKLSTDLWQVVYLLNKLLTNLGPVVRMVDNLSSG